MSWCCWAAPPRNGRVTLSKDGHRRICSQLDGVVAVWWWFVAFKQWLMIKKALFFGRHGSLFIWLFSVQLPAVSLLVDIYHVFFFNVVIVSSPSPPFPTSELLDLSDTPIGHTSWWTLKVKFKKSNPCLMYFYKWGFHDFEVNLLDLMSYVEVIWFEWNSSEVFTIFK